MGPNVSFVPEETSQKQEDLKEKAHEKQRAIYEIKQALFDPYLISKAHDKEGRTSLASKVRQYRHTSWALRENITEKEDIVTRITQQEYALSARRADKLLELDIRAQELLVRLKKMLKIGDKTASGLEREIAAMTPELELLSDQSLKMIVELQTLKKNEEDIPNPKRLLDAYYEKMERVPLSNLEKRELLRSEVLEELSMDEYVALWQRLNPYFLSHITRQGFRDHSGMIYHTAGSQEFHNGFVEMMEDGKQLRDPMAVRGGLRARDEVSVKQFLDSADIFDAEDEENAKKRFINRLNATWGAMPRYPDETAVHFAAQIVADDYYGGERDNEVFFIYPSDFVASQHHFNFNGGADFTRPLSSTNWNDVFVWPSGEDSGISVDAGIVFLPEDTLVDSETGSQYASEVKTIEGDKQRVMIEDDTLVSAFVEWALKLNNESLAVKAYKYYCAVSYPEDTEGALRTCFDSIKKEMVQLGFDEKVAARLGRYLMRADHLGAYVDHGRLDSSNVTHQDTARRWLISASANWKKAENAISSKEYWERYFAQHPEQKPQHIVFYSGDPTTAIHEFQRKHGIGQSDTSDGEGRLLGFSDMRASFMDKESRAWAGYDELLELGHKIIAEHYNSRDNGESRHSL